MARLSVRNRLLLFVIGGVAGALGAYLPGPGDRQSGELATARADSDFPRARSNAAGVSFGSSVSPEWRELERGIENDPIPTLLDAAALREPAERRRTIRLVGMLWARVDPEAALQGAINLPGELQGDFLASVSSEWANLDAESFLNYADGASNPEMLSEGLSLLVATDPARVFEIAGRLPVEIGNGMQGGMNAVERAALSALAERNPEVAMRHVDSMLPQININFVAQDVVSRFARNDPDAALAWLDSLDTATSSHKRVVLEGIASVDFDRAFALATSEPTTFSSYDMALARGALSDPTRTADIATALLNEESGQASQVLEQIAASWARNPDDLSDWLLANSASIEARLAETIASRLSASDLEVAMGLVDRVPAEMRDTWITQVAGSYASQDPVAALDWVQQYQGQPFYEGAHSQVIVEIAESDPQLAATMLDGFSSALQVAAAPRIAGAMSAGDPEAAAEWAVNLANSSAASAAVSNVVSSWIQRDLASARNWAVGLERGEIRDRALHALISGSYGTSLDPRPILEEIDADETYRAAKRTAIFQPQNQPEIAMELLESMLDDPDYGEWARESLGRLGGSQN